MHDVIFRLIDPFYYCLFIMLLDAPKFGYGTGGSVGCRSPQCCVSTSGVMIVLL